MRLSDVCDVATQTWTTKSLGELVSIRTGKIDSNAATADGEFAFFTCSPETFRTDTYAFDTEAVLLAGNNAAGVFPIKYFSGKFNAYQRTYVLETLDHDQLLNKYLFYALQPKLDLLRSLSTGATTKFLTLGILKTLEVAIPPQHVQRKLAAVLGAYDDLIEVNRRRVEVLEEIARRIYTEWFVYFRFPGHETAAFVDSPLGRIPQGWDIGTVSDVSETISRGISPKYADDGFWTVINQKCIRSERVNLDLARRQERAVPAPKQVKFGDVLINSTGVGTLGRVALYRGIVESVTVDSHVTIARPAMESMNPWYGMNLVSREAEFERLGTGSTGQTELSRTDVGALHVVIPAEDVRGRFGDAAWPILNAAEHLLRANRNIAAIREFLLPKLVTGQIDVSSLDLDALVEDSVA